MLADMILKENPTTPAARSTHRVIKMSKMFFGQSHKERKTTTGTKDGNAMPLYFSQLTFFCVS